jgi:hypothetical protein
VAKSLSFVAGRWNGNIPEIEPFCSSLHVSANGNVTAAVTVDEIKDVTQTAKSIVSPAKYWNDTSIRGTIVVQFDYRCVANVDLLHKMFAAVTGGWIRNGSDMHPTSIS